MPYNCDDVRNILNGDFRTPVDDSWFVEHIESCAACQARAEMPVELENHLCGLLAHAAPEWLHHAIVANAAELTRPQQQAFRRSVIRYSLTGILVMLIGAVVFYNRGLLIQAQSYFDFSSIMGIFSSFKSFGGRWSVDVRPALKLLDSPFVIFGLAGLAATVWLYSILKIREVIKS